MKENKRNGKNWQERKRKGREKKMKKKNK